MTETTRAAPLDHHPDGTPMTQDEIDAHWLAHVYRPGERQLTLRAVVTGMLLGGVMSLSNLYVGLKTGWGLAVTVTASVLAFGTFSLLRTVFPRLAREEFTSLENNTMASAASAAGYFTGAGLTSAIPALFMATGQTFVWWELALWILAISFLGVVIAVPMRRQMIDVDRLPFPEGLAYAETIRSLHAAPGEARKKALALLYGAIVSGAIKLLSGVRGLVWPVSAAMASPILPEHLPGPRRWLALNLWFQTDVLMLGAGAMMGLRIGFGLVLGAIVSFGMLGPWLDTHGLAGTGASFATVRNWLVWPGVSIIVVNGLLAFALKWRTALAALKGLTRLASGGKTGGMAEVEVPSRWFLRGLVACTALVVVLAKAFFGIPLWMGFLAALMSMLLSIVACRATGETSITPIGALGKITQLMYGGLAAGNIQTNLMTASITAGAAMHSADLLTDLKGGYVLGAKPRNQFLAQLFGILAGAVFCIPAYQLLATPERLGSEAFPAPAAKTWQAVAELLAGGIDRKVRGSLPATADEVRSTSVALVPVGAQAGDAVNVPGIGTAHLAAVVERNLLFVEAVPGLSAGMTLQIVGRGPCTVTKPSNPLPAASVGGVVPEGTAKGDYLKATVGGQELWWNVKAVVDAGRRVVLDRPLEDPRNRSDFEGSVQVEVRKESLPPYALEAVLVAALVAIVLTLLEVYAPRNLRKFVPSCAGLGLGFVISGFDSISMFLGALLAWAFARARPQAAEQYTLATASGLMAGGSLAGIVLVVLSEVLKVFLVG